MSKSSQEYSVEFYLILPTITWKRKTLTYRNTTESTTKLEIPIKFMLTNNKSYFILELAFIFGLGLRLIDKE